MREYLRRANEQAERFWSHIDMDGDGCWDWLLGLDKDGYGKFTITLPRLKSGKQHQVHVRAHRFAYELVNGPIRKGLLILHDCDNPRCCRPSHLSTGTQLKNRRDAVERGRVPRGERHPQAKLTEQQAVQALDMKKSGIRCKDIASLFGVATVTIQQITRQTWKHLRWTDATGTRRRRG